ncbi:MULTISPECIES: MliC family protein [unclassified Pseudomonas]|nr:MULTISPECIES: MliC family protein [unclassified Pseudomonas]
MFDCASNGRISVTFFQTEPPSLTALYKGRQSLMLEASSASGSRYLGQNESFWEHQGEAAVTWGHGAEEMICKKAG